MVRSSSEPRATSGVALFFFCKHIASVKIIPTFADEHQIHTYFLFAATSNRGYTYNRNIFSSQGDRMRKLRRNHAARWIWRSARNDWRFFNTQLAMNAANSIQTQSFLGMTNQYDPRLHEEASFIKSLYPGATYIRVKYLDRIRNRISCTIKFASWPSHKIHVKAYSFDNLRNNLERRLSSQPTLLSHYTKLHS